MTRRATRAATCRRHNAYYLTNTPSLLPIEPKPLFGDDFCLVSLELIVSARIPDATDAIFYHDALYYGRRDASIACRCRITPLGR